VLDAGGNPNGADRWEVLTASGFDDADKHIANCDSEEDATLCAAAPLLFELLSEIADAYEGDEGLDEMMGRGVDSQLVQAKILVQQLRDGTFER
jgi:hypothetical protein